MEIHPAPSLNEDSSRPPTGFLSNITSDPGRERSARVSESSTTKIAYNLPDDDPKSLAQPGISKNVRFWAILVAISFSGLLAALEATITSTALPTVIADLGGGDIYVWAVNGYFLAMQVE